VLVISVATAVGVVVTAVAVINVAVADPDNIVVGTVVAKTGEVKF